MAPLLPVAAGMGTLFGLKAFAVAIIGGIGSAWGVMIAGVLYGVIESCITAQLGSAFREALGFAIVIAGLAFLPNGLFGRAAVNKV
jgi:branched-chain amino acid transport system permease protein